MAYPFKPFATEKSRGDPDITEESDSNQWKRTKTDTFPTCSILKIGQKQTNPRYPHTENRSREIDSL